MPNKVLFGSRTNQNRRGLPAYIYIPPLPVVKFKTPKRPKISQKISIPISYRLIPASG